MIPTIAKFANPTLLSAARHLAAKGRLAISDNKLVFLDIDDDYIHQLFPTLKQPSLLKPNYFGEKSIGAHITVIYPEEQVIINKDELNQEHFFSIKELVTAEIGKKLYYVLLVEAPTLLKIRKKYNLPELLSFRGYSIGFHITIGTAYI